jgi:hypothetical protein
LVPVTNGSIPGAPDGGHSSHAGTLLEGAAVAVPDDPPEEDDVDPLLPEALDPVPAAPPPDPEPVAEPPDVDPLPPGALDPVPAAPPPDPEPVAEPPDVDPLLPEALDPVPAAPPPDPEPVAEPPDVDPVAGVLVAAAVEVAEVPFVVVVGGVVVVRADGVVRVNGVVPVRLTTPLRATVPGATAVCAEAGRATAIESSTAQRTNRSIGAKRTRVSARLSTAGGEAPPRRHSRLFPWNREFSRFCPIKVVFLTETSR